jgi:hypothetical protein
MPVWLMSLLGGDGGLIKTIASFIPNPAEQAKAAAELQAKVVEAYLAADADQREINKVEAASASMFVAGWRPAVGWLCVVTLAYSWVVAPLISWILAFTGHDGQIVNGVWVPMAPLPTLGTADSQTLLYALLGLGSLRTIDKVGGVDTRSVGGVIAAVKQGVAAVAGKR